MEQPDTSAAYGFLVLVIVFFSLLLAIIFRALRQTSYTESQKATFMFIAVAGLLSWMGLTALLAGNGFFDDFSSVPPRFVILILVPLVSVILVSRSAMMASVLQFIPPAHLVYLQSFRIFVELILWKLYLLNLLPVQMSLEGWNYDILAGISAPVVAYLYQRNQLGRKALIGWNIASLMLLINIVLISVLSAPVPFRMFMNEPANTIVATFPAVWLPALLVPLAYFLHILSIKQLIRKRAGIPALG